MTRRSKAIALDESLMSTSAFQRKRKIDVERSNRDAFLRKRLISHKNSGLSR